MRVQYDGGDEIHIECSKLIVFLLGSLTHSVRLTQSYLLPSAVIQGLLYFPMLSTLKELHFPFAFLCAVI